MREFLFVFLLGCTEALLQAEPSESHLEVDTGCGAAYQSPPDPAVIEAQFIAIPSTCLPKLEDPLRGPRCRYLMEKSLSGYFGEATRQEAIRVLGVQP
jgi:hypothetical protein